MITFSKTQETSPTLGPSCEAQAAQTRNLVSLVLSSLSSATMETSPGTPGRTGSCFLSSGFPGLLGHGIYPLFPLTVTCRPRLSPANHLSSLRPCGLQAPSGLPQPPQGSTPTWTSPVPGVAIHQSMPGAVWAVSSDVIPSVSAGISSGIQICSSPCVNCCSTLLIAYAHSPLP